MSHRSQRNSILAHENKSVQLSDPYQRAKSRQEVEDPTSTYQIRSPNQQGLGTFTRTIQKQIGVQLDGDAQKGLRTGQESDLPRQSLAISHCCLPEHGTIVQT